MAEKRCSIAFGDIRGVIFECTKCKATIGYEIANWKKLPFNCPNCGTAEVGGESKQMYEELQSAMVALARYGKNPLFNIRFEIAEQESNA